MLQTDVLVEAGRQGGIARRAAAEVRTARARRRKILFLAEGITMTHFVRPATLAAALDPAEWEVHFRAPRRYHRFLRGNFASIGDLKTIDPGAFLDDLARGAVLYSADALRQYARDELALFDELRPDLVVGDYRLSLCASAPASGVPFASVFNAQWSPHRSQPAIVPELPITRWVSPRVLNPLYALLRPAIHAHHAEPANRVRREFGLPRLSGGIREIYFGAANLVLYPDIPEFVPVAGAPAHHHYVGICPWSAAAPRPEWWDDAMDSRRPKVFVSLGSSGPVGALPAVLEALSHFPVQVLLATSGRCSGNLGANVFAADLLPYEETSRHCAAVISQGGTGGLYLALAAGTPHLAIPNNIDNHLSAALLEESGAGLAVRSEFASPLRLRQAIGRLLDEGQFKTSAMQWAARIAKHDTRKLFPEILRRWFAARQESAT